YSRSAAHHLYLLCSLQLCFSSLIHLPPCAPLFPYTTLFRSLFLGLVAGFAGFVQGGEQQVQFAGVSLAQEGVQLFDQADARELRSEEHTSELQSRENLVCRLLLEKKKHNTS